MASAFFPEGLPQEFPRRSRPTKAPTPPKSVFKHSRVVGWYEIDMMQHVNNAIYLNYIEEADVLMYKTNGYPMQRLLQNGIKINPRSHHIEYHQPAKHGDTLDISSWHSDVNHETFNTHYEIRRTDDGDLLVRVLSHWGFTNTESGKPCPIPANFLDGILNTKIDS
jgi:acyl-CoA thioester hydrolase